MTHTCHSPGFRLRAAAWFVTAALTIAGSLTAGRAGSPLTMFRALEGSTVRISGRATLGQWDCETTDIIAVIEPGATLAALSARISGTAALPVPCVTANRRSSVQAPDTLPYANITIPVASLRCSKPGMRRDLLRALKHTEAPLIVFVLTAVTDVDVQGRRDADFGSYRVTARGDLVLAGELRSIEVTGTVVQESGRHFRIQARKDLRMSDFGITPPTAVFGAIRADDRVTIAFDLIFEALRTPPLSRP